MKSAVEKNINSDKEQLLNYFIENNYDTDDVLEFQDECEEMIDNLKSELEDLCPTQDENDGSWTYGSREKDKYVEKIENDIQELTTLNKIADDCYHLLENYLYANV